MDKNEKQLLLKRILDYFETIAPAIVQESVKSLVTAHPIIELYDEDFYLEKMSGSFDDVDESKLQQTVSDNIDLIDDIFFKNYRTARKPSTASTVST